MNVSTVEVGFLNEELSWIYLPKEVECFASIDGKEFKQIAKIHAEEIKEQNRFIKIEFPKEAMRYVKLKAVNAGKIKSGMPGAGEDSWLFCDEILVR